VSHEHQNDTCRQCALETFEKLEAMYRDMLAQRNAECRRADRAARRLIEIRAVLDQNAAQEYEARLREQSEGVKRRWINGDWDLGMEEHEDPIDLLQHNERETGT
jgi:hypothetical protein